MESILIPERGGAPLPLLKGLAGRRDWYSPHAPRVYPRLPLTPLPGPPTLALESDILLVPGLACAASARLNITSSANGGKTTETRPVPSSTLEDLVTYGRRLLVPGASEKYNRGTLAQPHEPVTPGLRRGPRRDIAIGTQSRPHVPTVHVRQHTPHVSPTSTT